jgi:hypothetical protein
MAFRTSDAAHVTRDLASYDVVFRAALMDMAVEEKARVVEHLGRHMAPSAALVMRSAHDAEGAKAAESRAKPPVQVVAGGRQCRRCLAW